MSPLSGEAYDASPRSHLGDDDDEVVTSLWLPTRDLGVGDAGTDVGMLQEAFGLPATGVFDKVTAREIARWQGARGLPKSGYFGAASRERFANDAAAGLFRREPRVRARDASELAPSTSARTHGVAEDDIAQRRFIGVDSYSYARASPSATATFPNAAATSSLVAGAGAAAALGLAGAALARRALPDVFGGNGARPDSNRRGESPFDRLERLDRVDAADARENARRERARRFRDEDAAGVAGRVVAASRTRKKYPLAPPNPARLSSKSPFGHEFDPAFVVGEVGAGSTNGSSVRTPPRAARIDQGGGATSTPPSATSPTFASSSASSSSTVSPSRSSSSGTREGSWAGRPPSFDELPGFTPKRASRVDEMAEVNRRANGGGGRFVDERLRTRRTAGADDAARSRRGRGDFSSFGGTLRGDDEGRREKDADEDAVGDGDDTETRASRAKEEVKRRETEDDESGGIGGALMRAFGLDRRKAEFIERQKANAAAAAKKRDEADVPREPDETMKNTVETAEEGSDPEAETAEEGSDSKADADDPSNASSPFSPDSQMSYLERLKLDEAERLARVAADKARRDGDTANAEKRARIDAEKEALREERARLMREQSEREERRRARREKTRAGKDVEGADGADGADGAEGAVDAERAGDISSPPSGKDAARGSEFAERVREASLLAEKSRAAGRVLSEDEAATEKKAEKEMSFEERVAAARAQAANSGVADQMKVMFSRTDGDAPEEDDPEAEGIEKSQEDTEGSQEDTEGSQEDTEGSKEDTEGSKEETETSQKDTEKSQKDTEASEEDTEASEEDTEGSARTEAKADSPDVASSSPSDVSDASLQALSDDMDAISDDDFHRRVAEAARAVDFAESVLSDAPDVDPAVETEAMEAEMAAKALEATLAEKEAAAKKAAMRAKASREDLTAQMEEQMRAAAEAEAEWERAMKDAAEVANARRKDDETHFDRDGWAERAQRDLDEAMRVIERAETLDSNEDEDGAEIDDAEGSRADREPAAEESPAMTPVERRSALVRALRGIDTGVIMRRPEADEKPPEEKSPEETRPEATAEAEKETETVDGTAKDGSVAPPESQSTPPKKKKGRFAAMLDEDAVEAEYETSIRGTPPPPSKPAASVEPTTSDPPEDGDEDDSYLLELDDDDYCAPDDEACLWGLESKGSLVRALRAVDTSAIMTATKKEEPETREDDSEVATEDSAAAASPPEPKKGKKKGRFAAMLDEDAVETEYETSIRGAPPRANASAEERLAADSESRGTEPETALDAEVSSAATEAEDAGAEHDASSSPPASPPTKKGPDWDEDKRSFAERVAAAREATQTQASSSSRDPSKGTEPTPEAAPAPVASPSLARARALDTGAIMRAPVSGAAPAPEPEPILANASDEQKSEDAQNAEPKKEKKKGRFAAMLDEDAVETEYETSIRGAPPRANAEAKKSSALEPPEPSAAVEASPAEAAPAEAAFAEADANLEVSAQPEPDVSAADDVGPEYSMPVPRPAAPPGWWDTHEWPPAADSEVTSAEAETTAEPPDEMEPENEPSGHELRTPAPGASEAFFAARITAARDDVRAIHDELRDELVDDAETTPSTRPFVDPESESNDAFDAKVRRAIADAAMDADPAMMRDSDAYDRARYAAMLQERARNGAGANADARSDSESGSFALQPGDHPLRTPRDPTVEERSAFGPEYAYASVGRDGIAAGWRWRGMDAKRAPAKDAADWATETRNQLKPPARGTFMGAPASVLQPNLASIVDDAAAAAEREAALARAAEAEREAALARAAEAGAASAAEQPRAESTPNPGSPPTDVGDADEGPTSPLAARMDPSRNTRAFPREEGEEMDEENLRARGASFDEEEDDVVAFAETSDEGDAPTCVEEECFEEENLRPMSAGSSDGGPGGASDATWDEEEEEDDDDDDWNEPGPGYSSRRPWDDEASHMRE